MIQINFSKNEKYIQKLEEIEYNVATAITDNMFSSSKNNYEKTIQPDCAVDWNFTAITKNQEVHYSVENKIRNKIYLRNFYHFSFSELKENKIKHIKQYIEELNEKNRKVIYYSFNYVSDTNQVLLYIFNISRLIYNYNSLRFHYYKNNETEMKEDSKKILEKIYHVPYNSQYCLYQAIDVTNLFEKYADNQLIKKI